MAEIRTVDSLSYNTHFASLVADRSCVVATAAILFGANDMSKIDRECESARPVDEQDEEQLRDTLPWQIETFPCKYLGLQLSIKGLTRSDWQPIVDAALWILPGWQRGMVTRPGRLILINQVMRA